MTKKQLKIIQIFLRVLVVISLAFIIFSSYFIYNWFKDNNKTDNELKEIKDNTILSNKKLEEKNYEEFDPYNYYKNLNYMEVDFNELSKINKETVAWVKVEGTGVNYPVVKHSDNKYYLTHSFDRTENSVGWVFMDYRNNTNDFDKNTIIYAHGRKNGVMFGTLKNILKEDWSKNYNNRVVKLSTENNNTLWEVISVYKIPTTNDYIQTSFSDDKSFLDLTNKLVKRSEYDFKTKVNASDKILTLSTCYNKKEKLVLHAKLLRIQNR